jgi:hypothetical protein
MFKLPSVLALLGGVWMLFLFFNAADVMYFGPDQSDDRVEVSCDPFVRMSGGPRDFDDPLTIEQRRAVSDYVERLREYESGTEQEKVRTDAEQSVLADCARARQDRVALMILVATGTVLLVTRQLIRGSRTDEPEPEPEAEAEPAREAQADV